MSDDGAANTGNAEHDETPSPVEMEFVDSLPGGRSAMALERDGRLLWLVVKGDVTDQARVDLLAEMNHMVCSGLWRQDWPTPQP